MAVRDFHRNVPQTVRARIVTVDTTARAIEAQLKDVGIVPVVLWQIPAAFRWPIEGEYWTLDYVNGYWHLGHIIEGTLDVDGNDIAAPIEGLNPGDLRLNSPTIRDSNGRLLSTAAAISVRTVTSNTVLSGTDSNAIVLCDATAGALTLTLPTVSENPNITLAVKKIDNTVNVVIITGGAATIDGASQAVLTTRYQAVTLVGDGTAWYIL